MSLKAYQTTAARAEDPRQTEYRLFGQVTRALMDWKFEPSGQKETHEVKLVFKNED